MDIDTAKLVNDFQQGNEEAFTVLCEKYKPLMLAMISRIILSSFPGVAGSEHDVLMQEATMALYDAARSFDAEQSEVTFGLYSKICIRNRLVSVKRKFAAEKKKKNKKMSASTKVSEAERVGREVASHKHRAQPNAEALSKVIDGCLSEFEKKVFGLYLQNLSYSEIAEILGISLKSVDNALYRIRCKLKNSI